MGRCCSLGVAASETGTFVGYEEAADKQRKLVCGMHIQYTHSAQTHVNGGWHIMNYAERQCIHFIQGCQHIGT